MFQHQGIWFPDGEKHFPGWMDQNGEIVDGKGTYQIKKWRACIPHIKQWRVAVDVGAHVGLWSMHLRKRFAEVWAFEPVAAFRECFNANVPNECGYSEGDCNRPDCQGDRDAQRCGFDNFYLWPYALGAAPGRVAMFTPPLDGGLDTGGTHVKGGGDIEMRMLDSFGFENVDFCKLDCEGYEHHVIEGARKTLLRCKPCVIVEQKPHKLGPNFGIQGLPAVDMLKAMGAEVRAVLSGDYIMSWS